MSEAPRFLADEMLGTLARELRVLGYDAAYVKDLDDDEVLERAREEARLLLTRDRRLAERAGEAALLLEARDPGDQVDRVVQALELSPDPEAFLSRCLGCNVEIEPTHAPGAVPEDVESNTHWRCPSCGKVYWLGSHAHDMLDRLGEHLPRVPDILEEELE